MVKEGNIFQAMSAEHIYEIEYACKIFAFENCDRQNFLLMLIWMEFIALCYNSLAIN
jgi:hypothetical protein